MKTCFVCMPLIPELADVYGVIENEVKNALGGQWTCLKANDSLRPGLVTEKVGQDLLNADLVVAVLYDPRANNVINPNVMYELGIAHSFRKPTIVVAEELPFDIHDVEAIKLDFSQLQGDCRKLLHDLQSELRKTLREPRVLEDVERRHIPGNPVTAQLREARIFIEDLPWLWGYCDVLKRERAADSVWEITRDLFWAEEDLFFESIKEAIEAKRKHYFMVEDDPVVLQKVETVKNDLQKAVSKNELESLLHFVAIKKEYFVLWPIAIVLYDADSARRKGGIICEPMQSQVGEDDYDAQIRALFVQYARSGDLDRFQRHLLERNWTERRKEKTFDIALDKRVVAKLAVSFIQIWNERIVEEAQKKSGDEKATLLNTWLIGGTSE